MLFPLLLLSISFQCVFSSSEWEITPGRIQILDFSQLHTVPILPQQKNQNIGCNETTGPPSLSPFGHEVLMGLMRDTHHRSIPIQWLYDDAGSEIYSAITDNDLYYLTKADFHSLMENKGAFAALLEETKNQIHVVEVYAGDGRKVIPLLEHLACSAALDIRYSAVDISARALHLLQSRLDVAQFSNSRSSLCSVSSSLVVADIDSGLDVISKQEESIPHPVTRLTLLLGNSIGNLALNEDRVGMLTRIKGHSKSGDLLLIGFDRVKSPSKLHEAYNFALHEQFLLGVLKRVNRELGGNFDVSSFEGHLLYNARSRTMEPFIMTKRPMSVRIEELDYEFELEEYEAINLGASHKFTAQEIGDLAEEAELTLVTLFEDSQGLFYNCLLRVP